MPCRNFCVVKGKLEVGGIDVGSWGIFICAEGDFGGLEDETTPRHAVTVVSQLINNEAQDGHGVEVEEPRWESNE